MLLVKRLMLALGACLLLPAISLAEEVYEINFQSQYVGPHVLNLELAEPWIQEVREQSNNRLTIHFFMNGAIVKTTDTAAAIKNGTLDFAAVAPTLAEEFFPQTISYFLPYAVGDALHSTKLIMEIAKLPEIQAEWANIGKVLWAWGSDRSGFFSNKGPVLSPADLKGRRVLVWSGGHVDQVKAWGGIPVQTAPNDTYMSLQRGVGDIFFGPLPAGVSSRLIEVAQQVTVFPVSSAPILNMMNWGAWEDLPTDIQELLDSYWETNSLLSGQLLYEATDKDLDTMRQEGCTIHFLSPEQIAAFREADRETITHYWVNNLKRLGISNPEAAMARTYDLAHSLAPDE